MKRKTNFISPLAKEWQQAGNWEVLLINGDKTQNEVILGEKRTTKPLQFKQGLVSSVTGTRGHVSTRAIRPLPGILVFGERDAVLSPYMGM